MYHNPRCSKSRATKALLESEGIEFEVVEYLRTPPDAEDLARLLGKLHLQAADLIRKGEAEFEQADIDAATASEVELIELMARVPKLIERPIVEVDDAARIGRPPERVLELFK
jgi:arsenate reductase